MSTPFEQVTDVPKISSHEFIPQRAAPRVPQLVGVPVPCFFACFEEAMVSSGTGTQTAAIGASALDRAGQGATGGRQVHDTLRRASRAANKYCLVQSDTEVNNYIRLEPSRTPRLPRHGDRPERLGWLW